MGSSPQTQGDRERALRALSRYRSGLAVVVVAACGVLAPLVACSSADEGMVAAGGAGTDGGATANAEGERDAAAAALPREAGASACAAPSDAGAPDAPTTALEMTSFCHEVAAAFGSRAARCAAASAPAIAMALEAFWACEEQGELAARGRLIYVASQAPACLDAIESAACDALDATACASAIVGTVPAGQPCYTRSGFLTTLQDECASGSYCADEPSAACPLGTCRPQGKLGASCKTTYECEGNGYDPLRGPTTAWCDYPTKTCVALPTPHNPYPATGPCASPGECAAGSQCIGWTYGDAGACTPYKALGESCRPGLEECGGGLYCASHGADAGGTCLEFPLVGETCGGTGPEYAGCWNGLCKGIVAVDGGLVGTCAPPARDGELCSISGFSSSCDVRSDCVGGVCRHECTPLHHCGDLCEPCCPGGGFGCAAGSLCVAGRCEHCGGPGEPCCYSTTADGTRTCTDGACCVPVKTSATATASLCVAQGEACGGGAGTCNAGSCSTCGGAGEACCFTDGAAWCSASSTSCMCVGKSSPANCHCQ